MSSDRRFEIDIAAARSGDESALAALYRKFQPPLLAYLRSQVPTEAEDLAAETWIAAARGLRRFRGDESDFRRWIFTIARRRLVDHLRNQSRRPRTVPELSAPAGPERTSPDAESEALERLETRRALEQVAALPPDEAEVIVLRVIAGLSAADVGAITDRSPGAVRVLQHRALRHLAGFFGRTVVTLPVLPTM